jgi:hypothetical protein
MLSLSPLIIFVFFFPVACSSDVACVCMALGRSNVLFTSSPCRVRPSRHTECSRMTKAPIHNHFGRCVCNLSQTPIPVTTMSANDDVSSPSSSRLSYTIAGCSEHSNRYVAENIMVDSPKDPNSRWSGQHESPSIKQWILLQLDELSVVGKILVCLSYYGTEIRAR